MLLLHCRCLHCAPPHSQLCQQMIVINANAFLKSMWSTIKVLFRAETIEKFIVSIVFSFTRKIVQTNILEGLQLQVQHLFVNPHDQ